MKNSELPSVKALHTFMVVAGTMNFSKAATRLSISQGAVSKQVASLENQLGQPLFYRHINGIELTEAGKRYLPKVTEALELIQSSTANLLQTADTKELLTLNVTPSFSNLWLINEIDSFVEQNPNLQVSIKTGDGPVRNSHHEHDLYIRCLPLSQHYEGAQLINHEQLVLVVSPTLLKHNPIDRLSDLSNHTFIVQVTRPQLWAGFLHRYELAQAPFYSRVGYEHFYMSLTAVYANRGLALVPRFMVDNALRQGLLINPLDLELTSQYGYYLIAASYKRGLRKVYQFEQWLGNHLSK